MQTLVLSFLAALTTVSILGLLPYFAPSVNSLSGGQAVLISVVVAFLVSYLELKEGDKDG